MNVWLKRMLAFECIIQKLIRVFKVASGVNAVLLIPFSLKIIQQLKPVRGTSLVVQWLRLISPNAGDLDQGTRSHMPQLRVSMLQGRLKITCVTTKTHSSQIDKIRNKSQLENFQLYYLDLQIKKETTESTLWTGLLFLEGFCPFL